MSLPQKTPAAAPATSTSNAAAAAPASASAKPALAAVPSAPLGPQAKRLQKGQLLFAEGENSRAMYFLKTGMIRLYKKKGDAQIELDTVRSGQVLGELAFLDGNPRSASGEALTECELVEISGPTFQAVLGNMPDWLKILLKAVVGRLRTASTRIRQLETASTAVDYSDKTGKRSVNYVYLSQLDVLKILSAFLLLGARYSKPMPDGKGVEIRIGLLNRYVNQIMGVPEAKATTLTDVLTQNGVIGVVDLPNDPSGPKMVMNDIQFLDQLIAYLNEENLVETSKRHDITPRGFYIMSLIARHLHKFKKDEASGYAVVNLADIRKAEVNPEGKEPFRIDEFECLVNLGYATNADMKSSTEVVTLINPDHFMLHYRFQRFCMGVAAVNEQKRK